MILKIDTTKPAEVTVKLLDKNKKSLGKITYTQKLGSQVLLPMIQKILKKHNLKFEDLSSVEVNPGPGSFTGTRVGIAVAMTLGFALNIPVNGKKDKIVMPIYEKSKFDL